LYLNLAKPESGIAQLEEAAKIDPHQPVLFGNLAAAYAVIRKFDASEGAARAAVNLDRTGARPLILLGFALMKQRKFTKEVLECLERSHDEYPVAYLFAARVLEAQGNLEKAKSEIQTYLTTGEQQFRETATRWLEVMSQGPAE
jgi:tetratricopeptide (TPR) repeat protein